MLAVKVFQPPGRVHLQGKEVGHLGDGRDLVSDGLVKAVGERVGRVGRDDERRARRIQLCLVKGSSSGCSCLTHTPLAAKQQEPQPPITQKGQFLLGHVAVPRLALSRSPGHAAGRYYEPNIPFSYTATSCRRTETSSVCSTACRSKQQAAGSIFSPFRECKRPARAWPSAYTLRS